MDKVEGKISAKQFFIIYVIGMSASIIRIVPVYSSFFAKEATWISALIAVIPAVLLIYVLYMIMRKGKDNNLAISLENILGKVAAKCVMFIYVISYILFLAFRIRYFAEKCLSSIFPNVQIEFFVLSILFVTYLMSRNTIQGLARFSEAIWIPLLTFIIGVLLIITPEIKISNIYPVTLYDTKNILMGVIPILSVFVYLPGMMFLADRVADKENLFKEGKKHCMYGGIIAMCIVFTTMGIFGTKLTQELNQPYFSALKNIELFKVIERVEALGITFWIVTDVVLIVMLMYIITTTIKILFNTQSRRSTTIPLLFLEYILSMYIASSIFELEKYSKGIGATIYIVVGTIIPFIVYIVGKFRKVID